MTIALIRFARRCGMANAEIERMLGLDLSRLDLSDISIDPQQLLQFIHTISVRFSVRVNGIQLAEYTTVADYGITAYLLMNCRNMREVLENKQKYFPLMGNVTHLAVKMDNDLTTLSRKKTQILPAEIERMVLEYLSASILARFEELTGKRVPVINVEFSFLEPVDLPAYQEAFGQVPFFDKEQTTLSICRSYLELPLQTANSKLLPVFEEHARACYSTLIGSVSASERVGNLLAAQLPCQPQLEDIAGELGFSSRTLKQNLKNEGTTFSKIRDQIRYQYARQALERNNCSITEVGLQLGFFEHSSFFHAFKRWSGKTPLLFQNDLRNKRGC